MSSAPEYVTSNKRHLAIYNFLTTVWGRQLPGFAFIGVKSGDRWKEFAIDIGNDPEDHKHLKRLIEKYSEEWDFYFAPSTFRAPHRVKENALETQWVHCDIDQGDVSKAWATSTIRWETSPGRQQALWLLDYWISPKEAEPYNRRLAKECSNDGSGWDCTKYLRVPYTFNHKPGRRRFKGKVLELNPGEIKTRPEATPAPEGHRGGCTIDRAKSDALDGRALAIKHRIAIQLKAPAIQNDRSRTIMWQAGLMHDAGATNEQMGAMLWQCSRVFRDKYKGRERDGWKEIERLCRKLGS